VVAHGCSRASFLLPSSMTAMPLAGSWRIDDSLARRYGGDHAQAVHPRTRQNC
jgi:hypothetical protein